MKCTLVVAAFLGCVGADSRASHPIEGVITLLKGLEHTAEEEGKTEALSFQKFEYWCRSSETTLQAAVAQEKASIEEYTDTAAAKTEELATLGEQITALQEQLAQLDLSSSAAQLERGAANALYTEANQALADTITAINTALKALQDAGTSTAAILLARSQVRKALPLASVVATTEQRNLLASFAAHADDPAANRTVQAAGDHDKHIQTYGFKSGNVIELLKGLKAKFEEQQLKGTKAETNAANAFALQKQATQALVDATQKSKESKEGEQSAATVALNSAKQSLADTQKDLEADSNTLTATQKQCSIKRSEWAERSKTRAQEIEALKAAQQILAKVGGVRIDAPANPVLPPSPLSSLGTLLVQGSQAKDPKLRAVELLRAEARAIHSKALERLAQEVSVRVLDGPFDEVNNMIQKMIFRLMKEQTDEDQHKHWCDLELNKTEISIDNKAARLTELKAQIDEATATINLLALNVKEARASINTIDAHVAEATEIRETGKRENALALKDAQDAQTAITNAIAVLEAHYKSSGMINKEPWEFVQRGVELPDTPSTWEAGYTGVADPSKQPNGIVAVLEKVLSGFSKMEAETRAQEVTDQKAFNEEMKACSIEKARLSSEIDVKSQEQQRLIERVASLESTHKHVSNEHEATVQYLKDLQPACVEGDSTYEARKAARDNEIGALKQAQTILADAFKETTTTTPAPSFLQRRLRGPVA